MASTSTRVTVILAALGFALAAVPVRAQPTWRLITPEEEARDDIAPHVPAPPDQPAPPTIDLLRPDISQPIQNPVTIEVRFEPGPGNMIDMDSFRATYGWLGINITRRLLAHAELISNGLIAHDVELPSGSHRVTLSIADTAGKRASRTFNLSVSR